MLNDLFARQPLLLLFVIIAIGYPIGQLRCRGVRMGSVAILLTAIGFGALFDRAHLPEIVYQLGLVIFVYALGLNSGLTLRGSLRDQGLRANILVCVVIILTSWLAIGMQQMIAGRWQPGLDRDHTTGMLAGVLTGTPALAAVLDYVKHSTAILDSRETLAQLVVGYSVGYPVAIFGLMGVVVFFQKWWRIDYGSELRQSGLQAAEQNLRQATVSVTNPALEGLSVAQLIRRYRWGVVFGRYRRDDKTALVTADLSLQPGDVISVIGKTDMVDAVIAVLGEESAETLHLERSNIDYQRFFVSNPAVSGARLRDLKLPRQFGAVATRIRRGDVEFSPHGDTVLQPGDRVQVVAVRDHMEAVGSFLGDSYRKVSEVNLLSLGVGVALGLLLGSLSLSLSSGVEVRLGYAGGPLIVGVILGMLRRSGPLDWIIPYSAHQTISQIGIVLFLAGVGTRAGNGLGPAVLDGLGLTLIVCSLVLSIFTAVLILVLGHRVLKIPFAQTVGILAGLQTQSAILEFCLEQSRNELPKIGYTTVYPVASLVKIVAIQLVFLGVW